MAEKKETKTQVAVIGGGPGGYAAAFMASDLGMEVTLVDPEENPGGVCLYRGCIPAKTLLQAAKLLWEVESAGEWGIDFGKPRIDLDRLRSWKDEVVTKLTRGVGQLSKHRKIRHIQGRARFDDPHSLTINSEKESSTRVSFNQAIVATGARPAALPGVSFDSPRVLDSTKALELQQVPETLLVVGGGFIGLELGSVYASLGSRVTIAEMMPGLLPGADRDLVSVFTRHAEDRFEAIMLETAITLEETDQGIKASFQKQNGTEGRVFEKVLITVGRRPNTENLGLENTRVELNEKGFVKVNSQQCTAESSIYAVGDVTGGMLLAHEAAHQGRIAAEVIAGRNAAFEPQAIPVVEYTDPEIAWCGLTENQAQQQNREVNISRFPWRASGRAATMGRKDGITKIISDPDTQRVLGVGIAGPWAGELIGEGALAVEMAATVEDLSLTIHPHPTLSETLMEAAEAFFGQSTHIYRPKRK
ncbi:MAG: dihydrolipoyl dehydrogenase [Spirochaetota bacterium]